jgi:hypothetical protein
MRVFSTVLRVSSAATDGERSLLQPIYSEPHFKIKMLKQSVINENISVNHHNLEAACPALQ